MYTDFSIWQVTPCEVELCKVNDLQQALRFIQDMSLKFPKQQYDLRVKNEKGIVNLGVFVAGKLVGLDSIGK